jgi:hypothetical protein
VPNQTFGVSKLTHVNGTDLTFAGGEITLIVGPNNSGKSTFLREIRNAVKNHEAARVMFNAVKFTGASPEELKKRIYEYFYVMADGTLKFVLGPDGSREFYLNDFTGGPSRLHLDRAADAFVTLLNSEGRLLLSRDVATIDLLRNRPRHPYHVFMLNPEKLQQLSERVKEAFGLEFAITRIGTPIRGYVAKKFDNSDTVSNDQQIPRLGKLLEQQGDGIRSYLGIVAEMQAMSHPVILVDEPEAFLHPPQAKRLGRTIVSELEKDRQGFLATHSSDFLQGVLSSGSDRIRVIRLDWRSSTQTLTVLNNRQLTEAISHPSIANTNLLDSLFFDQTVVCEGDADCKIFDWLLRGEYSDTQPDRFWFSAGGKHQIPKIVNLLHSFELDWRVILDLDALTDWSALATLAKLKGLDLSPRKKRIESALRAIAPPDLGKLRLAAANALTAQTEDDGALREVSRILEGRKFSAPLKQYGLAAIRNGQERQDVETLLNDLRDVGICLLRKGELESYVPSVGPHGPAWVSEVLEKNREFTAELTDLRSEINLGLLSRDSLGSY